MHCTNSMILAALSLITAAAADDIGPIMCVGNTRPNWDDCRAVLAERVHDAGTFEAPGEGKCVLLGGNDDTQNCDIVICPHENIPILKSRVSSAFALLVAQCGANESGGKVETLDPDGFTTEGRANPEFRGTPTDSSMAAAGNSSTDQPAKRAHARALPKRQQESDTSFDLYTSFKGIRKPGTVFDVGQPIPGDAMLSRMIEESMSQTITTGVSFSAGIEEIFSASAGVEVSESYEVTSVKGVEIKVDCPDEGQIEWHPLFDRYEGTFQPSGDDVDVWIPLDNKEQGEYDYRCLG